MQHAAGKAANQNPVFCHRNIRKAFQRHVVLSTLSSPDAPCFSRVQLSLPEIRPLLFYRPAPHIEEAYWRKGVEASGFQLQVTGFTKSHQGPVSGALYPSKSGLMNKHIVKPEERRLRLRDCETWSWRLNLCHGQDVIFTCASAKVLHRNNCDVPETFRCTGKASTQNEALVQYRQAHSACRYLEVPQRYTGTGIFTVLKMSR